MVKYIVARSPDPETYDVFYPDHPDAAHLRCKPIALNIHTKRPMQSWTDSKSQLAISTVAWVQQLAVLPGGDRWPAIPLLIAQGHDWHLLIVSKDDHQMTIWEKIPLGSTRSYFDTMKVVASLHWLFDWLDRVWEPWLLSLVT